MRMGIPPALRGRVWKCLLNIDKLRESSAFNYQVQSHNHCTYHFQKYTLDWLLHYWKAKQFSSSIAYFYSDTFNRHWPIVLFSCVFTQWQKCLDEIRGPLVDLGVSEYGIISAIATLNDTENDLGSNQLPSRCPPDSAYSSADVTIFRQIALDLRELWDIL